ncbi:MULTISPECIES: RagB/SusD family nutrient uptake outer membrane protein [Cellulophaga]|uniref:RagB/SusD family nutrient uptake outer membrane protein n=1 Tax=Cellulophaga TaxID=104264 RepID=UPI002090CBC3|nr:MULTISPECIES: RagB/SusD family nutrient uptake outer membrane protein [Cellulophaga]MDO6767707.1 RagB/SusD family nutrient uptake outer membrane protein [Cellulophaga sp. 1_MG-2023]
MMKNIKYIIGAVILFITACTTEDLDPTLSENKETDEAITSVDNLYSLASGLYDILTESEYYGRDLIAVNEVRSDNCFSNGNSGRFTTQSSFLYSSSNDFIWDNAYNLIANCNIVINQDLSTLEGDSDYGSYLQGQALIIRALAHYDLLKTYGQQHADGDLGVPIMTEYDGDNLDPSRNTIEETKAQIYSDVETAFDMMDSSYDDSNVFVGKYVAKALESRVAIYFEDWDRALAAAEEVINSGLYSVIDADSYVSSWSSDGGSNVLFELAFSATDNLSSSSLAYIYRYASDDDDDGYGDVQAMSDVFDLYDEDDVRLGILGYQLDGTVLRNMNKFPDTSTGTDNIPLFRYEEVILNYAEALLETGADAVSTLNMIALNRGEEAYTSVTKDDILLERRKELIFEGFRFDDMMRTESDVDYYNSTETLSGTLTYPNNLFAYPITDDEIDANSNMVQNDGY